jgi:cytoskeleton protein RodZ
MRVSADGPPRDSAVGTRRAPQAPAGNAVVGTPDTEAVAAGTAHRPTAGAKLRSAREAAGLSVDAVAQQLKLAPRQVKALEDDDWHRLPGRTFVRGFARNYARFVQLDPDAVLALMPAAEAAPALERPAIRPSGRTMGEIPVDRVARPPAARWLIVLLLLAVIAGFGWYAFSRQSFHLPALLRPAGSTAVAPSAPVATVTTAPAIRGTATSVLPNPVANATPAAPPATDTPKDAPAPDATVAAASAAAPSAIEAPTPAALAPEVPLVLTFKGTSWAEVKDARGRVVLQMTGGAGMTQTVTAAPPLELALGNAPDVGVTFRGQPLDLSAYTRGGVARVALR